MWKKAVALWTPYTVGDKPKRQKLEVVYDPMRALDEARVQGLWSWINSTENPKETCQGGTTNMDQKFFRDLLEVEAWISNEVHIS